MARVVLEKLTKHFKGVKGETIRAVNEASLSVENGEFLVLVGPSGCGKSTTLRLIAGLEEITSGTILMDGKAMTDVLPKDRDVAMVFQNFALYPHMTVHENMAFGLTLRKIGRAEIEQRVNNAAELLGLKDCLTRKPAELSGGQKQRVAVGRAMVLQPKVFLFDEPLSNLDAPLRVQMRREIAALHTRLGTTMIYVTHDQVEAMTLGHRIAVMKEGVIQQVAAPMELYHHPANLFVAGFIGSPAMNFFPGAIKKEGDVFFIADCGLRIADLGKELNLGRSERLADYVGKKVVMGLRAENIKQQATPDGVTVEAMVELIEPLGAETYLYATIAGHSFVARTTGDHGCKPKQVYPFTFEMSHAHFFDAASGESLMRAPKSTKAC